MCQGDWEEAIENYREAIRLFVPGDERAGDAGVGIAYCLLNLGNEAEASEEHYLALEKFSSDEKVRILSAAFWEEKNRRYKRELRRRLDRIRVVK
ncbi:MAG: hypothetical protein HC888_02015 [Candidatus Competibacteraceae bacterium]|nr:hypothetical protein [Candidatus Competibacteraceae bacterium]